MARLKVLLEASKALPEYKKTVPSPEFLVGAYYEYAGGK